MADRPNLLWFCTDQQRFDTVGALGNEYVHTPNLDRLVEEGFAFTRTYCQSPICTPSRASFLTGMLPGSIRACTNGNERWAGAAPLVTKLLSDAGYDCGLSGKLHLSAAQDRREKRPDDGYRAFHWSHGSGHHDQPGHDYQTWLREQGHSLEEMRKHPASIPPELHQTTWCTDRAIDFVREAAGRPDTPWLFSVNVFDPHPPYDPPQPYLERYDVDSLPGPHFRETDLEQQRWLAEVDFQDGARPPEEFDGRRIQAAYWAMVDLIDENLGRLLEALEETGQLEDTVIIFTSDHGEMLGDHGLTRKGCRFYEALVRVPLILRWPARFRSGLRSDALVELMDLAPTVLELGGLEPPKHMQARSLLPILTGRAEPDYHRDLVRCQYYSALPPREVVPGWVFEGSRATMVRDERYKLTAYHTHDLGELYDLQEDPWEFQNLWDDPAHREQRHRLLKRCLDEVALSIDLGPPQVADY